MAAYAYQAGAGAATVNVPGGVSVKTISCYSSAGSTVTIAGGATITVPAGIPFDEDFAESRETLHGPVAIVFGSGTTAYFVSYENWGP